MHGVGRGARDWGYPVFIPEAFDTSNTRWSPGACADRGQLTGQRVASPGPKR